MSARFGSMVVVLILGVSVGMLTGPRPSAAQIGASRSFFGALKVGDMVETAPDPTGKVVLRTYDDEFNKAKMIARVTDVAADYIALEIKSTEPGSKTAVNIRYPIHSILAIFEVTGATAGEGGGDAAPADSAAGKPKGPLKTKKGTK